MPYASVCTQASRAQAYQRVIGGLCCCWVTRLSVCCETGTCHCRPNSQTALPGVLLLSDHEAATRRCWDLLRIWYFRQELSDRLYRPRHIKGGAVPNWLAAVRKGDVLPQPNGWPALEVVDNDTAQVCLVIKPCAPVLDDPSCLCGSPCPLPRLTLPSIDGLHHHKRQ